MGALFGLLYWNRGLVCSMSAHATFNGLLAVIAFLSLSGAPQTVNAAGVSFAAPKAWLQVQHPGDGEIDLRSYSGAQVFMQPLAAPGQMDATTLTTMVNRAPALGDGIVVEAGTVRPVQYAAGTGAEAAVNVRGHSGYAVVLSTPREAIVAVLVTGGNANARPQFESMLQSLRLV
jgi:hypothetical protein